MKTNSSLKKIGNWLIMCVWLGLFLSSCKEDEDPIMKLNKNRGVFTATINGQPWSADEVWVKYVFDGTHLDIEGSGRGYTLSIMLELDAEAKRYDYADSLIGLLDFSTEFIEDGGRNPRWTDGFLDIKEYTNDTLVATFDFETEKYSIENGVVSVTLKEKFGEPAK